MATLARDAIDTAPTYSGPIFDGDSHIYEQDDAFLRYLPAAYREKWGITGRTDDQGEYSLYVGDRKAETTAGYMSADGRVPAPGRLKDFLTAIKNGYGFDLFVPKSRDMTHRDARLTKLDEFGVDGAIVFVGDLVGTLGYLDEALPAHAVMHAYNEYMLEEWGFSYKDRIYATPIISLLDLDLAINEAEWVIANGARVILLPLGPFNRRSPADPYFDPFWQRLNEAGVNISWHVSEPPFMHSLMREWGEIPMQSRQRQSAWTWMNAYGKQPIIQTISSFIFHNFFARFPNIKALSAEMGAEWVPSMLVDMDKMRGMAKNGHWPCGQLSERPSAIFKRNVSIVAYPEDDLKGLIDQAGGSYEWLLMGSDYPHNEGVPAPRDFVHEACAGLSDQQIEAVMFGNGRRFLPRR